MRPLIAKYNVPGPRYTSYPTVPYWNEDSYTPERWTRMVHRSFEESNDEDGISLYVHLPYCETPCTFCGCIKKFTRDHSLERPYVDAVLAEWRMYLELFGRRPRIKELHLGGGTPTFFSPENLEHLVAGIAESGDVTDDHQFGFEANPASTTEEHLRVLHRRGFRRISLGVQDFDPLVQETINRIQPYESVAGVVEAARAVGYESVNFDLIYGLPRQRLASIVDTMQKVTALMPDRIAFYGYAHVPWIKGVAQRRFSEADIPRNEEKRALYEIGRELLLEAGYHEIGMDHFALERDSLYRSACARTVHRNFMGYTPVHTQLCVGLGMSAIGDAWYAFSQNEKDVRRYIERVTAGEMPLLRGHVLDDEDLSLRGHILDIMCRFETRFPDRGAPAVEAGLGRLREMADDGLVDLAPDAVRVTEAGRPFVRNVCMAFDAHLWSSQPATRLFSDTI